MILATPRETPLNPAGGRLCGVLRGLAVLETPLNPASISAGHVPVAGFAGFDTRARERSDYPDDSVLGIAPHCRRRT
jgi:hypothetical protein